MLADDKPSIVGCSHGGNPLVIVVVVTLFPTEKQSTAYMSKDTYVNQYTLMFCWWSPEKPKAYLAGNQKSGRDRLSVNVVDQIHGFMNTPEWPAQPSSGDRLHQRARQPPAVRTDPLEHNSQQVRTHDRQPQGPARVPHPLKGPSGPLTRIPRLCPLHQRTAEHTGQLNIWAESWGAGLRGEDLKQLGLKDTPYLVLYISWMGVKSTWLQI